MLTIPTQMWLNCLRCLIYLHHAFNKQAKESKYKSDVLTRAY